LEEILGVTKKKLWIPDPSNVNSMGGRGRREVEFRRGKVDEETWKSTWQPSVNAEKMSKKSFRF
jgi:hypothetical protein